MHSDYDALAIDWVPAKGSALAMFGAGWSGWCTDTAISVDLPEYRRLRRGRAEMPGTGARRGLHAALKAPFRLARQQAVWALDSDLMALAQSLPVIRLPQLEVTVMDGHVVLALTRPCRPAVRLVHHLAELLRPFEASPTHVPWRGDGVVPGLSLPGMHAWSKADGMPVERFHLPLSDRMELSLALEMADALNVELAPVLAERQMLGEIALVGSPGKGRPWRLLERYALAEEPTRRLTPTPSGMACKGPRLYAPLDTGLAIV